jgi:LEA14-like dessication related protein
MKRLTGSIIISIATAAILTSCNVLQGGLSVYNLTNCNYKYESISDLKISGIDLSKGINPLAIPQILSILTGTASSIPLDFTVNIDVKNPNSGTAAFQALQYIVSVDDVQFTTGNFNRPFSVNAGEAKILPMNISLDIAQLMKSNSRSSIENIVKNFLGISSEPSNVTIQLKPSFKVGEQLFSSPLYIPVSFSFGGNSK